MIHSEIAANWLGIEHEFATTCIKLGELHSLSQPRKLLRDARVFVKAASLESKACDYFLQFQS